MRSATGFQIAALILVTATAAWTQEGKLHPVDEASKDPTFLEFRERLLRAVRERDVDFVLGIVGPRIRVSFGFDDQGLEKFKERWNLDRPETSELWVTLESVLSLGGSFPAYHKGQAFVAPYVFSNWPRRFDSFDHLAVVEEDVPVFAERNANAPVLALLSHDIVRSASCYSCTGEDGTRWAKIELADGRTGYVREGSVRSPIDYRAFFAKIDGRWIMTTLIAGD